jgi:phage shock protein E
MKVRIIFIGLVMVSLQMCVNAQVRSLEPKAFSEECAKNKGILLDVRTSEELESGKIAGAQHINFNASNFEQEVLKLPKSKTIYVYCAVGGRSGKAATFLEENGYKVVNLAGGINAWKAQKMPIANN